MGHAPSLRTGGFLVTNILNPSPRTGGKGYETAKRATIGISLSHGLYLLVWVRAGAED
jgi:hypothetical protein